MFAPEGGKQSMSLSRHKWVFPRIRVPQNGWFIMENPIKMDDLGVPLFLETPKCAHHVLLKHLVPQCTKMVFGKESGSGLIHVLM